jgi:sec-independent protein translocase protein TatA
MGALQPIHIILILAVVLLLFGGAKIPQLMRGIGQGTSEFKKGLEEGKQDAPQAGKFKDEASVDSRK